MRHWRRLLPPTFATHRPALNAGTSYFSSGLPDQRAARLLVDFRRLFASAAGVESKSASVSQTHPYSELLLASLASDIHLPIPDAHQLKQFRSDGFVLLPKVVPESIVAFLNERVDTCFTGVFDTNGYPDEWYWRPETGRNDVTRHMVNIYKTDRAIARVLTHPLIARFAAHLLGREKTGIRMGNDSVWVKPPNSGASAVSFHQDSHYLSYGESITAWLTLTDVSPENGTLEEICGSHLWRKLPRIARSDFHKPHFGYRAHAYAAAKYNGLEENSVKFTQITAAKGSILFHHGDSWHGSAPNTNQTAWRRSLAVHLLNGDVKFPEWTNNPMSYIYGRYRRSGTTEFDETFFPILWRADGYRTQSLNQFLQFDANSYPATDN